MTLGVQVGPWLDKSQEPWRAGFPGLGHVEVDVDGGVSIKVEDPALPANSETGRHKHDALAFGWGEPLSFARRGFTCLSAAAATSPERTAALLISGESSNAGRVLVSLASRGWLVLGDLLTPTIWDGETLVAYPRQAPVLMHEKRAAKLGIEGERVRADTDAVALQLPRHTTHLPVGAIVRVQARKPDELLFESLSGLTRFEVAASLDVGGALAPTQDPDDTPAARSARSVGEHLRIAALPIATLRFDSPTAESAIDQLQAWWTAATA